jgi:hypothetical protein
LTTAYVVAAAVPYAAKRMLETTDTHATKAIQ